MHKVNSLVHWPIPMDLLLHTAAEKWATKSYVGMGLGKRLVCTDLR